MKNSIYDIINSKLKGLVIKDDETPINYHTADIENQYHTAVSLAELLEMPHDSDIFKYDTRSCLTLITDGGSEISLHQYTGQKIVFLKIFTKQMHETGNEVMIYASGVSDHYIYDHMLWEEGEIKAENGYVERKFGRHIKSIPFLGKIIDHLNSFLINDIDGYGHCMEALESAKTDNAILPAISQCCKTFVKIGSFKYQGFLPASGQVDLIIKSFGLINYILRSINCRYLRITELWTSTELDNDIATAAMIRGKYVSGRAKNEHASALTIFKKL